MILRKFFAEVKTEKGQALTGIKVASHRSTQPKHKHFAGQRIHVWQQNAKASNSLQQVNLTCARDPIENKLLFNSQLYKNLTSMSSNIEPAIWSHDISQQIQVSIYHDMDVSYKRTRLKTKVACLGRAISWSITAILRDSTVAAVVRRRPWGNTAIAMTTMKKSIHALPCLSFIGIRLRLAAPRGPGTPLLNTYIGNGLASHPGGSSNIPSRLMLQKPG